MPHLPLVVIEKCKEHLLSVGMAQQLCGWYSLQLWLIKDCFMLFLYKYCWLKHVNHCCWTAGLFHIFSRCPDVYPVTRCSGSRRKRAEEDCDRAIWGTSTAGYWLLSPGNHTSQTVPPSVFYCLWTTTACENVPAWWVSTHSMKANF